MALKRDIAANQLRHGTTGAQIKEQYGIPDDIFYSNSTGASFQIWTYNITRDKLDNTGFDPIVLYIDNEKLVNWKY